MTGMPAEEWTSVEHVDRYLARANEFPRRGEGESVLLEQVPTDVEPRVASVGLHRRHGRLDGDWRDVLASSGCWKPQRDGGGSARRIDPADNPPVSQLVVRRRRRGRIIHKAGNHRTRAMKMLLHGRRPVDLRVQKAPEAGPVATLDRVQHVAHRWNLLGQSATDPFTDYAGSARRPRARLMKSDFAPV